MSPRGEKSNLKRPRGSPPDDLAESKKPRRSNRLSDVSRDATNGKLLDKTPVSRDNHLPSPLTNDATYGSSDAKELTPTPTGAKTVEETTPRNSDEPQLKGLSSPPQDTQPVSQLVDRHLDFAEDAQDETDEDVWGYLVPLDAKYGDKPKVLKKRCACPPADSIKSAADAEKKDNVGDTPPAIHEEEAYERTQIGGIASRGYLIGRHPECDIIVNESVVSNRHCLIFTENNGNDAVAIVEDLSSNGTFVNEAIVGRNQRLDLIDSMLVVDPAKRFTVDQCLTHPWLTQQPMNVNDSTGGLVGGIAGLEVNRRTAKRERTLLCHYNQVLVPEHVTAGNAKTPVKVFVNPKDRIINIPREQAPSGQRAPAEFMEMGGKGDQVLYSDDAKGKGK
ncbi:hypothetical protein CRV24_008117 [Beauveria bassiana]|nr:hypothetical protein CRV24_008117 [Beauveria bassiana]KAH8716177.1 hypothetical protein HC256_004954 [Beauveria bassiana]